MKTTYFVPEENFAVRKFRTDDLLDESSKQFVRDGKGRIRPSNASFTFLDKELSNPNDGMSLYCTDKLDAYGVTPALIAETISIGKTEVEYSLFKFAISYALEIDSDTEIVYDFVSSDPVILRGLCHYLYKLNPIPGVSERSRYKQWKNRVRNLLLDSSVVVYTHENSLKRWNP